VPAEKRRESVKDRFREARLHTRHRVPKPLDERLNQFPNPGWSCNSAQPDAQPEEASKWSSARRRRHSPPRGSKRGSEIGNAAYDLLITEIVACCRGALLFRTLKSSLAKPETRPVTIWPRQKKFSPSECFFISTLSTFRNPMNQLCRLLHLAAISLFGFVALPGPKNAVMTYAHPEPMGSASTF